MSTLLTVAIPTYNRAALLERQLAWLSRDLRGLASQCELLISDNASTDTTPEVIRRWAGTLGSARLRLVRQKTNLGAVRNIAFCIGAATGRHVWTISDDDPIGEGTLSSVLHLLRSHPELALLVLNFSSRRAGQLLMERCFEVSQERVRPQGSVIVEEGLSLPEARRRGGLLLTTALVYRRDLAQQALQAWPEGLDNLAVQLYWTSYCARHGSALVTRDAHLECNADNHFFMKDPWLCKRLYYVDRPEVMLKLMELGYSEELCRHRIREETKGLLRARPLLGCFRRWPLFTGRLLARHFAVAWHAEQALRGAHQLRESRSPELAERAPIGGILPPLSSTHGAYTGEREPGFPGRPRKVRVIY